MGELRGIEIGRIGVFLGVGVGLLSAAEQRAAVQEIEDLGYGAIWVPEGVGTREVVSQVAMLLDWTDHIPVGTAIASIYARDAMAMSNAARGLVDAYPGRFVLGLGVSHSRDVAERGHHYRPPVDAMRSYLDAMDAAEYLPPVPADPQPRVLAALGPKMLSLAADRTQGAIPYFIPVEHTAFAREVIGKRFLGPEQGFILGTDPDLARARAREYMVYYLAAENYWANLRRLGFTEQDRSHGGSDRLVDAVIAWGDIDTICGRVNRHFEAGADHVVIQALGVDPLHELRSVAPALLST